MLSYPLPVAMVGNVSTQWLWGETEDGQTGPFPALVGFSCGYLTQNPSWPPGPVGVSGGSGTGGGSNAGSLPRVRTISGGGTPLDGIELSIKASPDSVQWGSSAPFVVTLTPQSAFTPAIVDVAVSLLNGHNVVLVPETQAVSLGSAPIDVTFDLQPADRDSRLGCIDVEVVANAGVVAATTTFPSRVRPVDGAFTKEFDAALGPDNFAGNSDQTCATPDLPTRASETVVADAEPNGPTTAPFDLDLERDNRGVVQSTSLINYALLPASAGLSPTVDGCVVAFTQVQDPHQGIPPNPTLMNWNTIGFSEYVASNDIPMSEVTARRQSNFEAVAQIWMAPDSTAHLQVGGLLISGKRRAKAFDNISGKDSDPDEVCADLTSVRREGDNIIVQSRPLDEDLPECDEKTFHVEPPGGTDC